MFLLEVQQAVDLVTLIHTGLKKVSEIRRIQSETKEFSSMKMYKKEILLQDSTYIHWTLKTTSQVRKQDHTPKLT